MTDQLTQLRERIEQIEQEKVNQWRRHAAVTHSAKEAFGTYEAAARNAKMAANGAQMQVERLRADDTMNPEGRKRLVGEALAKGKAEVQKQVAKMEVALTLLKAELSVSAVPRVDKAREMPARDELRMLLDGSADPVGTMATLAQRDGELAAAACSSYGESYLRARGVPQAKEAVQAIRDVAAASAVKSADPTRRAIGEARAEFGTLEQSMVCTQDIAHSAIEAAEEAGAGL